MKRAKKLIEENGEVIEKLRRKGVKIMSIDDTRGILDELELELTAPPLVIDPSLLSPAVVIVSTGRMSSSGVLANPPRADVSNPIVIDRECEERKRLALIAIGTKCNHDWHCVDLEKRKYECLCCPATCARDEESKIVVFDRDPYKVAA